MIGSPAELKQDDTFEQPPRYANAVLAQDHNPHCHPPRFLRLAGGRPSRAIEHIRAVVVG